MGFTTNGVPLNTGQKSSMTAALGDLGLSTSVIVDLTADQINHLFSTPQTIVPAPGAGKAILIDNVVLISKAGTVAFSSEVGSVGLFFGSSAGANLSLKISNIPASKISSNGFFSLAYTAIENFPIVAAGLGEDTINGGSVAASSVSAGGTGYAPGDTGYVNPIQGASGQNALYVVDAVDGGGAVTAFHFSDVGYGYNVGTGKTTNVSTGGGDGNFTIDIASIITGNGSARVVVLYRIIDLL